jgi:hypothetical protein
VVPFACALRLPPDHGTECGSCAGVEARPSSLRKSSNSWGLEPKRATNRGNPQPQQKRALAPKAGIAGKAGSPRRAIEIVLVMRLSAHAICVEGVS